ncbi:MULTISPECIES: DUF2798 domain-containing protein [unclassified Acinetobacter]|uniref:DUF2798 domain-containing protein n=1 Tax=unclassified Acinetobacter TaxID=196816 RepID=UPI0035B6CB2C
MSQQSPYIFGKVKKLPAKSAAYVMPLILSFVMSSIISGINIFKAIGLVDGFMWIWLRGWMISWAIAFPTVLVVLPLVRKIVGKIVQMPPSQ